MELPARLPSRFWLLVAIGWAMLFAAALVLDARVADAVHDRGIAAALRRHPHLLALWKSPGEFWFTAAVAAIACFDQSWNWRRGLFVVLSGAFSGLNVIPKWIVGRTRPFKLGAEAVARPFELHPFRNGIYGFFHQQNLSFPSGHACTAFALGAAVLLIYPRLSAPFFLIAAAVGMERVLENAHYCSDVIGAIPVAVWGVALAWRIVRPGGSATQTGGLATEADLSRPALNE